MIEPMRDSGRPTLIGAVIGVLLLGAVVAFAVLVPELDDDKAAAVEHSYEADADPEPAPAVLPDSLPQGLVAADSGDLGADVPIDGLLEQEASAGEELEKLFDAKAVFRLYASPSSAEKQALAQVVVIDGEPGLFTPETIPIDPALLDLARPPVEMQRIGDAVCSVNYGQPVAAGQPIDPTAPPLTVRCQQGAGGRTYDISTQGLTVEEAIEVLEAAIAG